MTPATHAGRRMVALGASSNGSVMLCSSCQSSVLQILSELSSAWVARYCPTGSKTTPLTKPTWASSLRTSSAVHGGEQVSLCWVVQKGFGPNERTDRNSGRTTPRRHCRDRRTRCTSHRDSKRRRQRLQGPPISVSAAHSMASRAIISSGRALTRLMPDEAPRRFPVLDVDRLATPDFASAAAASVQKESVQGFQGPLP